MAQQDFKPVGSLGGKPIYSDSYTTTEVVDGVSKSVQKNVYYVSSTDDQGNLIYRMIKDPNTTNNEIVYTTWDGNTSDNVDPVQSSAIIRHKNRGTFKLANPGGLDGSYDITTSQTPFRVREGNDGQGTEGQRPHGGVDWLAGPGSEIHNPAMDNGEVITNNGNGHVVIKYQDPNGGVYVIQYNHMPSDLKVGAKVDPNTIIGKVGENENHLDFKVAFMNGDYDQINGGNYKSSENFSGYEQISSDDFISAEQQKTLRSNGSLVIGNIDEPNNPKIINGSDDPEWRSVESPKGRANTYAFYQVGDDVYIRKTGLDASYDLMPFTGFNDTDTGFSAYDRNTDMMGKSHHTGYDALNAYEDQADKILKKYGYMDDSGKLKGLVDTDPEQFDKAMYELARLREQTAAIAQSYAEEGTPEAKKRQAEVAQGMYVRQKELWDRVINPVYKQELEEARTTLSNLNQIVPVDDNQARSIEKQKLGVIQGIEDKQEFISKNEEFYGLWDEGSELSETYEHLKNLDPDASYFDAIKAWFSNSESSIPEGIAVDEMYSLVLEESDMMRPFIESQYDQVYGRYQFNAPAVFSTDPGGSGSGGRSSSSQGKSTGQSYSGYDDDVEEIPEKKLERQGEAQILDSEEQTTWDNTDQEQVDKVALDDTDDYIKMLDDAIALNDNYEEPVDEVAGSNFDPGYIGDLGQAVTGALMMGDIPGYEPSRMFTDSMALSESMKDVGLTEAEKAYAMELAKEGYDGDVENIRRMSGGSAGTALANLGSAANRYGDAGSRLAAEDRAARRLNRNQYHSAARDAESVNRQIYEDDLVQDTLNMEAAAQLMNDGLYNARERNQFNRSYGPNSAYGRNLALQSDRQKTLLEADKAAAAANRAKNSMFLREERDRVLSERGRKPAIDPLKVNDYDPVELVGEIIKDDQSIPLPPNVSSELKWDINEY